MNKKRILSMLLCVMMVVSLFVGIVPSASAEGSDTEDNGLVTSKVYDPNTGKLTIEAYATGKTITTVTEEAVPCDIVLVLDVSGSMTGKITSFSYSPMSNKGYSYSDLANTTLYYKDGDNYYQVKRGNINHWFSADEYYLYYEKDGVNHYLSGTTTSTSRNTVTSSSATIWTGVLYTRSSASVTKIDALKSAANAFIDTVAKQASENDVDHRISVVKFAMDSYYGSASSLAEGNHKSGSYNYTEVVKNLSNAISSKDALKSAVSGLTAGGATAADYGMTKATYVLNQVTDSTRNKVVIMFTDGAPTHGSADDDFSRDSEAIGVATNAISASKALKQSGVSVYTVGVFGSETDSIKTYMNGVSSNYPNASSYNSLGSGKDLGYYQIVGGDTDLTSIFTTIANESTSGGSKITLDSSAKLVDVVTEYFDLPDNAGSEIKVHTEKYNLDDTWTSNNDYGTYTPSIEGKKITVTGFDYAANYVGIDESGSEQSAHGSKLVIEIPITPNASIDAANTYPTNTSESGVYDGDGNAVELLPIPEINVAEKTYVIDYAKALTVSSSDWGQDVVSAIHDSVGSSNAPAMSYGTVSNTSSSITYTPNTMKWNGSDTLYSYQENGGTEHTWAKVSFVPANNVYYEDTFVSTDNSGIVYTGTWTEDGRSAGNVGTANTAVTAGSWKNASLGDDAAYSDGSAHMAVASNDNRATASFTFTGTGVDVYSRTNETTGTIFATIKGGSVNKAVSIDNKLQGKDFYQVPTLSFSGLPYDTYAVTIYVTTSAGADRATYYLDGIRVYNPADFNEDSSYPVAERNAQFTEIRDSILKAGTFSTDAEVTGAVFVDSVGTDANIADYKDYGPKHEVYLAQGQAIVFNVGEADNYYVGLSAPEGATEAAFTNGRAASEQPVGHASDLYYKMTPNSDGYIMIENTGSHILAVSKLYTADSAAAPAPVRLRAMSYAPTMSYVSSFKTLSVVPYDNQTVDPDDSNEPTVPADPTDPQPTSSIIKAIVDSLFRNIKNLFKWF